MGRAAVLGKAAVLGLMYKGDSEYTMQNLSGLTSESQADCLLRS